MVKNRNLIAFTILLLLFSCSHSAKEKATSSDEQINIKQYSQKQYELNVLQFLKILRIDFNKSSDVIFLNSSVCRSCVLQVFYSMSPFLSKTCNNTILFINDSVLLKSNKVKNPLVQFLYFNRDVFESNQVIHNAPYLYHIANNRIISRKLDVDFVDSLNNRVNRKGYVFQY